MYVYFDNDANVHAPHNAMQRAAAARRVTIPFARATVVPRFALLRRAAAAALLSFAGPAAVAQRAGPSRAAAPDAGFAALVASLSDSGGYFDSDNIITNEGSYLQVASQLERVGVHGGAYLGVGPDQNFSYIALIRPRIAFIVDVRRDNLLEQLLFKSVFERSRNRLEYLCRLLGRRPPADLDAWTGRPVGEIAAWLEHAPADTAFQAEERAASNAAIAAFGLPLDARDRAMIDRYRAAFAAGGLETRYSSLGRNNAWQYPSFEQLMLATDRAGRPRSYLADEDAFRFVRDLERAGLVVPVVGNVADSLALPAIGREIAARRLRVSAFYLSNVEQYLMTRDGGFDGYARNVERLPRDSASVIIRSYFGRFGPRHPLFVPAPGNISTSMIERMDSFVRAFDAGELRDYPTLVFARYVEP